MAHSTYFSLFNADWYLARNPDVAASLIPAEQHFLSYGKAEGRAPGPLFNPQDYLAGNPDVAAAVAAGLTTAYDHFTQYGAGEDRSPLALFDAGFYLAQNPDVAEAVAAGHIGAVEHFLLFGQGEPRRINPFIDLGAYANANPDVAEAAQAGMSVLGHLLQYGAAEGRDLGNGLNLGVFANDPRFQAAIDSGNFQDALERVQEVAPFLPGFQPPAGWAPPANTPIPTDFKPPAGTKLVIPPSVAVPPDTELPDTFEPVAPAPPFPTPGGGGGGAPSEPFKVTVESGVVTFADGSGDISFITSGTVATFSRGGVPAATTVDLGTATKITVASGQTLAATAAQVTGMSVDGDGTVAISGLESTLNADLSKIVAATATASFILTGDGQGAPSAFSGNVGNAKVIVTAERPDYMGNAADFVTAAMGNGASFEVISPASLSIRASELSGKTVTGTGTAIVHLTTADASNIDTQGIADSVFLGINVVESADISTNVNLVNVDGYQLLPDDPTNLPTLTMTAAQADGKQILNGGHVIIIGLIGTTSLTGIVNMAADPNAQPPAPVPTVKAIVTASADLGNVDLSRLTALEISGSGITVTVSPAQYAAWKDTVARNGNDFLSSDATAPTATITAAGYDMTADALTLTGTDFDTLLEAGENADTDIKGRLDWTRLVWNIDGDNAQAQAFAVSDIASAKVTADGTLTIALTPVKATALKTTAGFGGANDTLVIAQEFARDLSGNAATTDGFNTNNVVTITNATFTVELDNGVITFGGNLATGDITVTESADDTLIFTREGIVAENKPTIASLTDHTGIPALTGGNKLLMTAAVFAVVNGKLADGAATVDADGETDPRVISALVSARAKKIAEGGLKKLTLDDAIFAGIPNGYQVNMALADQGDGALTVNGADTGVTIDAAFYTKGMKLNGGGGDDTITGSQGDDIISGGAGDDTIGLSSYFAPAGSDTVVYASTAADNGQDAITGFIVGATAGSDVLDFSRFVSLTGGLEGTGDSVDGTFDYLTAGAASGGTDIAGKIFLWRGSDTTALAALIDSTAGDGRLGLADGEKAVVLYKSSPLEGIISTFYIAYITGAGNDNETIETVGTVYVNSDSGLVGANFGL